MRFQLRHTMYVITLSALASCAGSAAVAPPEGDPYIRGPIQVIDHRATASRILVESGPGSQDPCGISATVDEETRYLLSASGMLSPGSTADLEVGDTVEVYVTGPLAESCPLQGYASTIVRLSEE